MKHKFSFDGKGINDKTSEYSPRIATFTSGQYADTCGPLIAAAPEMLAALKAVLASLTQNKTFPADIEFARGVARDAIAKAENKS